MGGGGSQVSGNGNRLVLGATYHVRCRAYYHSVSSASGLPLGMVRKNDWPFAIPFPVVHCPEEVGGFLGGREPLMPTWKKPVCVDIYMRTDICVWLFGGFHPGDLSLIHSIRPRIWLFKYFPKVHSGPI